MHVKPVRYQNQGCLHFITFSCYQRQKLLDSIAARDVFEQELERVRGWYEFFVTGYVVMPEHVHLLLNEPERGKLSLVMQMLKQITSRNSAEAGTSLHTVDICEGTPCRTQRGKGGATIVWIA